MCSSWIADGNATTRTDASGFSPGLPRVLDNTLPDYLLVAATTGVEFEDDHGMKDEWTRYGEYLEAGARININLRSGTKGSI